VGIVTMVKLGQIQRTPPPLQANVLHQVNPLEIFSGLEEIGHGSFGEVYKVQTQRPWSHFAATILH
jgi:hypothetical protein